MSAHSMSTYSNRPPGGFGGGSSPPACDPPARQGCEPPEVGGVRGGSSPPACDRPARQGCEPPEVGGVRGASGGKSRRFSSLASRLCGPALVGEVEPHPQAGAEPGGHGA